MINLPHLRLEGTETAESYVYAGAGGSGPFDRPKRNQPAHAKKVHQELDGIDGAVKAQREKETTAHPDLVEYRTDGVVLTFRSEPNHELSLHSLERYGEKIELLGVKVVGGVQVARVFVPDGKLNAFLKLIEVYAASVVLIFVGDPDDEEKLKALSDPDNGIKFRGPVFKAKSDDLEKLKIGSAPKIKVKFIVAEAEVDGFKKKVSKLATLLSEGRQNQELVDSIASVRLAIIEDFWQDSLDFPKPNEEIWWEFWLHGPRGTADTVHQRFTDIAAAVGINLVSKLHVAFPERVVVHAKATPKQISSSIDLLAMIGELRKAKELASHYVDMEGAEQADFVADVVERIVLPGKNPPCVCIIDWGVNRSHPMLKPALAEEDQHASKPEWGVSDSDKEQHGTGMAGLALYGCLTDVMKEMGKVKLRHVLESVKIMPPPPAENDPPDYGRRMQDGVAFAHIQASKRNRALCMALTASDHRDGGLPSLWSGAVDDLCSGAFDGARRLMFISAGNMREEISLKDYVYHDWNITRGGVEDPGQAWNALTVGAFTEKIEIRDKSLAGYEPLAEAGGLCPTSRTSLAWPEKLRNGWPIKPDLVMEGGNHAAKKDALPLSCDDLSLLSTVMKPDRLLTTMLETSAATALAARMAATIWSYHPDFWPETVRALMVHTASWTPAMRKKFPTNSKSDILQRLRCYGYGVPNLQRALHSAQNAVTLLYQGEFQPFHMDKSEIQTNHMNAHDLPWPIEVLQDLGEEEVTMRVTLSYFIEPSPGNVGWGVNHRYASHGLRFDVIRPTENLEGFKKRISRAFWNSPDRPTNAKETRGWVVGEAARKLGSLHSDWWTGSAATLARSGNLVVYPVSGWWRERKHLERYNQPARYSLIISIRSSKESVDLYTPIVNVGTIQTEVIE